MSFSHSIIFLIVYQITWIYCQYGVAPAYIGRFGDYYVPRYVDYAGPAYGRHNGYGTNLQSLSRGGYRAYGGLSDLPPVMTVDHSGLGQSELYRGLGNPYVGSFSGNIGRQYPPYATLNQDPYRLRLPYDSLYGSYSKS